MSNNTVLITGAFGQVGKRCTEILLSRGRTVVAMDLPGDPDDDRGWSFTGWYDTTESEALLDYQKNEWSDTVAWVAESRARLRPVLRVLGPILRPRMRLALAVQRRREGRGPYADPWTLIGKKYGPDVLAPTDFSADD
jgi:hypothetical protein